MRLSLPFCVAMIAVTAPALAKPPEPQPEKQVLQQPVNERFAVEDTGEVPDFQRHVMPLFGRLGCNGRACHGSFQGRGGFRLSLFGYDFKKDHESLLDKESPRVDLENPAESLIIAKPTDADLHEGGQRYALGSWQHRLLQRWIESGAAAPEEPQKLSELEVTPAELWFQKAGEKVALKVVAVWQDGTREDVTPLCRYSTNDDQVCEIDQNGSITSSEPGDTHVVVSYDNGVVAVPVIRPVSDKAGKNYPQVATPTKIDELVVQKLSKLGVVPSELCDDATFLRRLRLDVTGTLPSPEEVEKFLADKRQDKRNKKIDELLGTTAYATWWTTKLCDFTGNNDQQLNNASPMRGQASREWFDWIYKRVSENTPYDQLAEGIACATGMKPGQSYLEYCEEMSDVYRPDSGKSYADLDSMTYYWARQDFREIEARAIGFAYSFMGIRIQCAQCHKHPFDQWSKDDFHQFKNFFARVVSGRNTPREFRDEYNKLVEELGLKGKRGNEVRRMLPELLKAGKTVPFPVTYNSPTLQRTRNPMGEYPVFDNAKLLGGDVVDVTNVDEPRKVLMDWLRSPDNRFFARAFVNRVWASYFGRGIVEPPDDLSLANPPSNKPLLDYLAKGFIENNFDMKWVHRTIAQSNAYQRSWRSNPTNAGDEKNFSRAVQRRLPAEVAYDAIQMAAASSERFAEMHTEMKGRAIAIPGANYRNRRGAGNSAYALSVFGRSTRDSNCDCDRSSEPTLLQTVYLQNDRDTLQMVSVRRDGWLDEVARRLNPKQANNTELDPKRVANFRSQLQKAESQLKKMRKKGGNERQVAQLKRRVDGMKERLAQFSETQKPEKAAVEPAAIEQLIKQAYLRTLSRYPNESEQASAQQYVEEADDTVNGVRDVLWALINTKEFIVNH